MRDGEHLGQATQVAGYRVLEKLHEGGMAVLYGVASADGGEDCLLKIPKLSFGNHPACSAGFDVEQMILGRIAGPHVPRLLASGEEDFGPYLVIERIAGISLADVARRAPRPVEEVARLGAALASALHELHRQEVVHHDVKPSHVYFRANGQAVLIDFGLAFHGQLPDLVAAESDRPLGTPAYMAPEEILGVRGDPRSDVFSLGVILYLLATGVLPFGAPTTVTQLRRRLYCDPPPPRRIQPDLPEWLQEVILHCLESRGEDRYATAAQVADDLSHPQHVVIGERGRRLERAGLWTVVGRWFGMLAAAPPPPRIPSSHLAQAPRVLVAIDLDCRNEALMQALRDASRRLIAGEPHWRLTCVTVMEPSMLTEQDEHGEITQALHMQRLVELRHWAQPLVQGLGLAREQIRFHVLLGGTAADLLIEYARAVHADHIVMGARGSSSLRRFLGSVSARVVAEAPCSVTVVRAPASAQTETSN